MLLSSMHLSTFTWEGALWSRCDLYRHKQLGNIQNIRALNWTSVSYHILIKLRDDCGRRDISSSMTRASGGLQGVSIFWIQQGSKTQEITVVVIAFNRLRQVKDRPNSSVNNGSKHVRSLLHVKLLKFLAFLREAEFFVSFCCLVSWLTNT